jgi:hypothetical protein
MTTWVELNPGSFWTSPGANSYDIELNSNASTVIMITDYGIQTSANGGTTWTMFSTNCFIGARWDRAAVSADAQNILLGGVSFDPNTYPNPVQISSNAGVDWTTLDGVVPEIGGYIVGISGNGCNAGVGFTYNTNSSIATSFDGGATWSSIGGTARGSDSYTVSYRISYDGQYHVVAGNSTSVGFLQYSDTYGSNFTDLTSFSTSVEARFVTISGNGQFLIAADSNRWTLSRDYGSNWEELPITIGGFFSASLSSNGQYGIIGNDTHWYTSDYGSNWTNEPSADDYVNAISYDGQIRYFGGVNSVYKSTDYDASYSTIVNPLSADFSANDMSSNGQYQIAVGNGVYWNSTDYGCNWCNTGIFAIGVACDFTGAIQFKCWYSAPVISKSTDYGSNWTDIYSNVTSPIRIRCSYNGSNIIFTDNTSEQPLFYSSDGGTTYGYFSTGSGTLQQLASELSKNGSTIIASYHETGNDILAISHDFGESWFFNSTPIIGFVNTLAVSYDGQKIAYSSASGTYFSIDGGSNFNEVLINGIPSGYTPPGISYDGNVSFFAKSEYTPLAPNIIYRSTDDGSNLTPAFSTNTRTSAFFEFNTPRSSWNGDYTTLFGFYTSIFRSYIDNVPTSIFIRPDAWPTVLKYFFTPGTQPSSVRLTVAGSNFNFPAAPNEIEYDLGGLTNNVKYSTSIISLDSNGLTIGTLNFRTVEPGYLPAAPESVAATDLGGYNVSVSWSPPLSNGDATVNWYVIQNNNTNVRYSALGTSSNRIINVGGAGTFTFDVYAVNDPGYSVPSTTAAVVIPAAAPAAPAAP